MTLSSHLPCGWPLALGFGPLEPVQSDTSFEAGLEAYLRAHPRVAALVGDRITPGALERGVGTFPAINYKVRVQHATILSGGAGYAEATLELNCWSSVFGEVCATAEALRRALQGFRCGWWGCCWIISSVPDEQDDETQEPKDGSGTYWYCRTLTYDVKFNEPVPTF